LIYIRRVGALLRRHIGFFSWVTLAALALRILFFYRFPSITADSFVYGDIAKNWLQHGIYGLSGSDGIMPTYIRLPGYPAFLALIFWIFGMEHYRAVLAVQIVIDIGTCFIVADLARRTVGERAARVAFLLAALCPFLANYSAVALTETLEIFFTAAALDFAVAALGSWRISRWAFCGLCVAAALLLRPDGGLLLAGIGLYLAGLLLRGFIANSRARVLSVLQAGIVVGFCALSPLLVWGIRNLRTLDRFELLAPRYADNEGDFVPMGFNRWVKTWMAEYASVEEIYWNEPGETIDPGLLPNRAFDSSQQRAATLALIAAYNEDQSMTPELDGQFAGLAADRIRSHPFRYYLWLPALRMADMWLRPRTELLPADTRWWEFNDTPLGSFLAVSLGVANLAYVTLALAGLVRLRNHAGVVVLLITFAVARSLFLGSLENPEPRYTLECYPVVIVLASALWT
jgi:4-amino-4-deoxy-L-arabinose transferase-like glycosyltransferase